MNIQLPEQFSERLGTYADELQTKDIIELSEELMSWIGSIFTLEDVADLVAIRAQYIDKLLAKLWCQHQLDEHQITLIAVGGYGRGELHPFSDIDIMLLIQPDIDKKLEEQIGAFITQLWDIRLDVGHSVRTIEDCVEQAKDDVTIATNLLELRVICGNEQLEPQLLTALQESNVWSSTEFFIAKREEQFSRHNQFHGAAYTLEPNLKASPGGLRDIQTIGWVAKKHFQANNLEELVSHNYLTRNEYAELLECQNYLWRMRFALHLVAKRNENRLLFDHQLAVSNLMGFGDEGKVAVESMMKRFFRIVNRVVELNGMLLQHFDYAILGHHTIQTIQPIDRDFIVNGNLIQVTHDNVMIRPDTIMRLFLVIAEHPEIKGIHSNTIRLLRNARRRLISSLQDYAECRKIFLKILRSPRGLGLAFTLMHKHGVIGSYLPQWRAIVGQMQFDLFHAYSVDEHSFRLIKNLYRFSQEKYNDEFPLCSKIVQRVRKPELLFIAGIFHDIAKGRGGDHAKLGAIDALRFSQSHKLNNHDGRMIAWLVKHHLLMSVTAQRQDITDMSVIKNFAEIVRDETHLDHLYCLTVADMRATNESLWNSWKANLLEELYFTTKRALRRGLEKQVDLRAKIRENQIEASEMLTKENIDSGAIAVLWNQFRSDYFLRHSPDQIAWHARNILARKNNDPIVLISSLPYRGGTEIFIFTKERANIFATIVTSLGNKKLSILDAKIISTKDSYTANTFAVLDEQNKPIIDKDRCEQIAASLKHVLKQKKMSDIPLQPIPRRIKQFDVPTQVTFIPTSNKNRTNLEIVALDRPGLLASFAQVFQNCKLKIHSAKITTFGERAEDIFTISTNKNTALSEQEQADLEARLCDDIS